LPYAPELNGIEFYWSIVKRLYKKEITDVIVRGDRIKVKELIKKCLAKTRKDPAKKCAIKGLYLIDNFVN